MLGRWCPSWRKHQDDHYKSTGSLRSSLRWATAVIHKLLLTAWDMWDYRNGRLHAFAGTRELAQHQSFNSDIESEFSMGSESLPADSRHLIDSYSFDALKQDSLVVKRQWLTSVRVARAAFTDLLVDPGTVLTAQAI